MPSDMLESENHGGYLSADSFIEDLRRSTSRLVVLDCRSSNEYSESHIRHAVNFSIPSIMLRRLAAGKIELVSTIKCRELKNKISEAYHENLFVVYGEGAEKIYNDTLEILARRLKQDGCQVATLDCKYSLYVSLYPFISY